MSLFIRVFNNFYSHRKTAKLRAVLGNDALWVPPRLWSYAAENQPDGDFSKYSAGELAMLIGYVGDANVMLQALLGAQFLDSDMRIHDWSDHNGYHSEYRERAKKAAVARWGSRQDKTGDVQDSTGQEASIALASSKQCLEHKPEKSYHLHTRTALHLLNEACGKHFREVDVNLTVISARLEEPEVTIDGVKVMISRQCQLWKGTNMEEYLRPLTLFGKEKFDSYYAGRNEKINYGNNKITQPNPRNVGVCKAGPSYGDAARAKQRQQAERMEQQVAAAKDFRAPETPTA